MRWQAFFFFWHLTHTHTENSSLILDENTYLYIATINSKDTGISSHTAQRIRAQSTPSLNTPSPLVGMGVPLPPSPPAPAPSPTSDTPPTNHRTAAAQPIPPLHKRSTIVHTLFPEGAVDAAAYCVSLWSEMDGAKTNTRGLFEVLSESLLAEGVKAQMVEQVWSALYPRTMTLLGLASPLYCLER